MSVWIETLLVCIGIGSVEACIERKSRSVNITVVDIFCLFYQQIVARLLVTVPHLSLGGTSFPLSILVVWMVLTPPSALKCGMWLSCSQSEHLTSLALATHLGLNIWLNESEDFYQTAAKEKWTQTYESMNLDLLETTLLPWENSLS